LLKVFVGLIVAFLLFGGLGYRMRDRLGAYYTSGTVFLALLVEIFAMLVLFDAIHL